MKKIELLSPAGDLEKLKSAYEYGADAVYMGIGDFSLRSSTSDIDKSALIYAVELKNRLKKKLYITLNILSHNRHLDAILKTAQICDEVGVDGLIVADIGVMSLLKENNIKTEIHVSTQANTTNYKAVDYYKNLGATRVNLARELSLDEITQIRKRTNMELEVFVHGAMCIAYSGRCLISRYLTNRSGNLGGCSHSCRFKYKTVTIKDDVSGKEMELKEDEEYSYLLASEEMVTLDILDKIIATGVDSLKIEGRTKSVSYLATVIPIYRRAIDNIEKGIYPFYTDEDIKELHKISPRDTWQGFYTGVATENYNSKKDGNMVVAFVRNYDKDERRVLLDIKMPFDLETELHGFNPNRSNFDVTIRRLTTIEGRDVKKANPNDILWAYTKERISRGTILKKEINW